MAAAINKQNRSIISWDGCGLLQREREIHSCRI
jgi:hypothetical protein